MKRLVKMGKIFLIIFLVVLIIFISILFIRKYNYDKYVGNINNAKSFDYKNIANYPKEDGDITIKIIDESKAQGLHLIPKNIKHEGLVITYGGSEGSPNYFAALDIAKHGYEVLSMFMFGQKNQPKTLFEVPLEQFQDVYNYASKNCKDHKNITIYAASKGAEYALNLANHYKAVKHLILFAPSSYNFAGLDEKTGSSWTFEKKPLPFIDFKKSDFLALIKNIVLPSILNTPISYLETYESAIEMDKSREDKKIKVSKDVDILLFAGSDDKLWPSFSMAKEIYNQNKDRIQLNIYENAGHIFMGDGIFFPTNVGGNEKDNSKANEDSNQKVYENLEKWHKLLH